MTKSYYDSHRVVKIGDDSTCAYDIVVRDNTITGAVQDAISTTTNKDVDSTPFPTAWRSAYSIDVRGNTITNSQDNPIEAEGNSINNRFWKNRSENSLTGPGLQPLYSGPCWFIGNTFLNFERAGVKSSTDAQGWTLFFDNRFESTEPDSSGFQVNQGGLVTRWNNVVVSNTAIYNATNSNGFSGGSLRLQDDMNCDAFADGSLFTWTLALAGEDEDCDGSIFEEGEGEKDCECSWYWGRDLDLAGLAAGVPGRCTGLVSSVQAPVSGSSGDPASGACWEEIRCAGAGDAFRGVYRGYDLEAAGCCTSEARADGTCPAACPTTRRHIREQN